MRGLTVGEAVADAAATAAGAVAKMEADLGRMHAAGAAAADRAMPVHHSLVDDRFRDQLCLASAVGVHHAGEGIADIVLLVERADPEGLQVSSTIMSPSENLLPPPK